MIIRSIVLLCALAGQSFAECQSNKVDLRGAFGQARFAVEVADDNAERAQGLMFREELADDAGMLFLYERPTQLAFWMRNTLIELDMLFLNREGRIQHIHHRAKPGDETPIRGGVGVAVLEISGGRAREVGIMPGDTLRHPFFGADAAWPC